MARRDHPLYRDPGDGKIAGVCSGLARYFDLDTTLVRVVFVALLVFGGGSLLAYLLLWVFVDPAPAGFWDEAGDETGDRTTAGSPDIADESADRRGPDPR